MNNDAPASPPPPVFDDPAHYAHLRELLVKHEYTRSGIQGLIGPRDLDGLETRDFPVLLRLTRGDGPLATLLRLFHMGIPVTPDAAANTFAPLTLDTCRRSGLITIDDNEVTGLIRLVPHADVWLASDHPKTGAKGLPPDFVIGVGGATRALAGITIRRRFERALDMGTGCGVFAVLAAAHCDHVVAVDRNPRALGFTRFNAALNGRENIECLEGDLFQPVADQRFDLVVCNPPFVISPKARYTYRDGGMQGDGFVRRVVREVPAVLAEGGFCQIMCQWAHLGDEPWEKRVAKWFEGSGCDVWVLRTGSQEPSSYAMGWIATTERVTPRELHGLFDEWMDYYDRESITCISDGFITMRKTPKALADARPDGADTVRCDSIQPTSEPLGEEIARRFELSDFLETHATPENLAGVPLQLSPAARLHQHCVQHEGGWATESISIRGDGPLAVEGAVNPVLAELLVRCDGARPVGDVLRELATEQNQDADAVMPEAMRVVRKFVEGGLLLPQGGGA